MQARAGQWWVVVLVAMAAHLSAWQAMHNQGKPRNLFSIYHNEFAPAVMLACGHGFVNVQVAAIPTLQAFLRESPLQRAATFDCRTLPAPPPLPQIPLDGFQQTYAHLIGLPGVIWRVTGNVAWHTLYPVLALFHALTAAALYGIFRLGMGTAVATLLTLFLACSGDLLIFVKDFRDYAKVPFLFVLLWLLGWLVKQGTRPADLWRVALLAGATFGVGVGFRVDVLILLPPFIITLLTLTPLPFASHLAAKTGAVVVLLATMLATGAAIFPSLMGGGNPNMNLYMGFSNNFSLELKVRHALHEMETLYHDQFLYAQMEDYAARVVGQPLPRVGAALAGDYFIEAYGETGSRLLQETIRTYPADVLVRYLAAVKEILNRGLPFNLGLLFAVVGIAGMALVQVRLALFSLLLLLWLAGYPALLFKERHYLHLLFLPFWAAGVVVAPLLEQAGRRLWQRGWPHRPAPSWLFPAPPTFIPLSLAAVLRRWGAVTTPLLALALLLLVLRQVQQQGLRHYFADIANRPATTLTLHGTPLPGAWLRLSPQEPIQENTTLLVLEFDRQNCPQPQGIPLAFRFHAQAGTLDFSREATLQLPEQGLKIILPVLQSRERRFLGLELPRERRSCVRAISQIDNLSGLTLLPLLTLPGNWQHYPLYQTLAFGDAVGEYSDFLIKNRTFDLVVPGKGF